MSDQEKKTLMDSNYKKLALLNCIQKYMNTKQEMVKNIIENDYNINYQIPANNFFKSIKPQMIGKTSLHIALEQDDIDVFNMLKQRGADFTIKDNNGNTVLHQAIQNLFKSSISSWDVNQHQKEYAFIKSILSAHASLEISTNPTNKYGLSHFHVACIMNDVKLTEFFLKNGASVNDAISAESPNFPGFTPLHFAVKYYSIEVIEILLKNGADIDLTDSNGLSPLHLIIKRNMDLIIHKENNSDWFYGVKKKELETNERIINLILTNCGNNQWNLADRIGMTRFHVVITLQSTLLVKRAIEEGADLRLAINADSPFLPGHTALHIAAYFNSDTVKILLENGGNLTVKDAKGNSPFDICLIRCDGDFICHLIKSQSKWKDIIFSNNKTKLTDFCDRMEDRLIRNFLRYRIGGANINSFLPFNSPLWPGYTIVHLTVIFIGKIYIIDSCDECEEEDMRSNLSDYDHEEDYRNIRIMKACLRLGADVTIQDANGSTPLHLAFRMNKQIAVNELLKYHSNDKIVNPADKDGLTHLHIACAAKTDDEEDDIENEEGEVIEVGENLVKNLLQNGINPNCSVTSGVEWKNQYGVKIFINVGWTPLHVAVASYNVRTIKILVEHGADIYAKDVNGLTPIHLILSSPYCYKNMGNFLLSSENLKDSIANCGLSHLHIACYVKNIEAIKKLLENGANKETVISYKLPQNCKHEYEFTFNDEEIDTDVNSYRSISYCNFCTPSSHEQLSFLGPFAGYTPLHMALMRDCKQKITRVLVQHGVNVHTDISDGTFPFYRVLDQDIHRNKSSIIPILKSNKTLQKYIEEKTGITMLHVNCAILDVNAVVVLLKNRADVNVKVYANSPLWPNCTPLHLISCHYNLIEKISPVFNAFNRIARLLLEKGADVMNLNSRQNSPIYEAFRRIFRIGMHYTRKDNEFARYSSLALLIKAQKDFSVNPTDVTGVSHFHIACMCGNLTAVQEFLKHGVDVNTPIDYFSMNYSDAGFTPLHFAIIGQSKEVVDLLIKHGADPNTTDHKGNTSLHIAVQFNLTNEDLFKSLISAGANLDIKNLYGATPIKLLFEEKPDSKSLEIFLKHGVRVNIFNDQTDEGYMTVILKEPRNRIFLQPIFKAPILNPKINDDDELNRSPIHNIVSTSRVYISNEIYARIIEEYVKAGFDLDRRDKKGRTALHLAIQFENVDGIIALLTNGADINIIDNDFNTPYAYCYQFTQTNRRLEYDIFRILTLHINKLKTFGLHVNHINKICDRRIGDRFLPVQDCYYHNEICELHRKKIHDSFSIVLFDFLSERNAVTAYPLMPRTLRDEIDKFFQTSGDYLLKNFPNLVDLIVLQYRKAKIRVTMIESAKDSLNFISKIEIPDLCSDVILRMLTNEDLQNLINSASAEWRPRKRIRFN